ncbi:MAG: NERD domain-containing protein [Anaerolineales bacterium]|nr:NERD domain-containing protein [Anaerolineales bacterium]
MDIVSRPTGILAFVIVMGLMFLSMWVFDLVLNWIEKRFDKRIDAHRLGREGEDLVVQSIVQVLDGNWYMFRNINLPGRNKGDLDLVLVGPPGVWVLEVKNYTGTYRNIGDKWEYKAGKKWKAMSKSPSTQATKNIGSSMKRVKIW